VAPHLIHRIVGAFCIKIFFSCSTILSVLIAPQNLVKFGDDPDLKTAECHLFLKQYMPPHVTQNKVLQQLFIK